MSTSSPKRSPRKAPGAKKKEIFFDLETVTKGGFLRFKQADVQDGTRASMGTVYLSGELAESLGVTDALKLTVEADNS